MSVTFYQVYYKTCSLSGFYFATILMSTGLRPCCYDVHQVLPGRSHQLLGPIWASAPRAPSQGTHEGCDGWEAVGQHTPPQSQQPFIKGVGCVQPRTQHQAHTLTFRSHQVCFSCILEYIFQNVMCVCMCVCVCGLVRTYIRGQFCVFNHLTVGTSGDVPGCFYKSNQLLITFWTCLIYSMHIFKIEPVRSEKKKIVSPVSGLKSRFVCVVHDLVPG